MARQFVFTGKVQGVGFRYTTFCIAENFPVTGYVKNRADGSVELLVQGTNDNITKVLTELKSVMRENIQSVEESEVTRQPLQHFKMES